MGFATIGYSMSDDAPSNGAARNGSAHSEDEGASGEWIYNAIDGDYFWAEYNSIDDTVAEIARDRTPLALEHISRELDKAAKHARGRSGRGRPPGIYANVPALKELRRVLGFTQFELATKCGLDEDSIQRAEAGQRVSVDTLVKIVEYANTKLKQPIAVTDLIDS
jgi:hypothetical protein